MDDVDASLGVSLVVNTRANAQELIPRVASCDVNPRPNRVASHTNLSVSDNVRRIDILERALQHVG